MGVDVTFKAKVVLTDGELEALRERCYERWPEPELDGVGSDGKPWRYPDIERSHYPEEAADNIIELNSLHRFYGPAYARGPWPEIREMGDWLAVILGERGEVRYGSDSADDWEYLHPWAEVRAETDAFWAEHGNEPYRRAFR